MRHLIAFKLFFIHTIVILGGVALFLLLLPPQVLIPHITHQLWMTCVWTILGMFALALIISIITGRYVSGIFSDLQRVVRAMAEGRLSERIPVIWPGIIGRLGIAINTMAETLTDHVQQARREQAQLKAILDTMQEALVVVDSDGQVLLSNPASQVLLAMSTAPVGQALVTVCRSAELTELVDDVLQTASPVRAELSGPPIAPRVVLAQATPLKLDGQVHGVVVVGYDTTPSHQLEDLRREFVANVSHELKTPLTAIRGYSETLLGGALTDPEVAPQFVAIINRNAEQMQRMVEDLLALSTIEAGQVHLVMEEVHVPALVDDLLQHFQPRLLEKKMTHTLLWSQPDLIVHSDRRMLSHVLSNLIDNAIKYSREGDEVRISGQKDNGHVVIEVADTGIGMTRTDLPRVFDRFWRADKSRTRGMGGTGLGLSIAKRLVTQLRGQITVQSTEGQGTVFTIRVPA